MNVFQENLQLKVAYSEINYNKVDKLSKELEEKGINLQGLHEIKHKTRRVEWLFIRKILNEIHPKNTDIVYDNHGKPHFKDSNHHISISHSKKMIALSINEQFPTGIDIQYITDKVVRIKDKFLNDIEQERTSKSPVELSHYWSCKEALFKVYGKKDSFLKENFFIESFHMDQQGGYAEGMIKINSIVERHHLKMRRIGNYVMAYVVNY